MEYGGGGPVERVRMGEVWFMSRARPRLPVITVYLVRARARRPPPAAASRSVPLQMASGALGHTASAPNSVLRASRVAGAAREWTPDWSRAVNPYPPGLVLRRRDAAPAMRRP